MKTLVVLFLALFCLLHSSVGDTWPEFRGPHGNGISDARGIPEKFDEETNLIWKTNLPGRGWSSPVYDGERLWLTTAVERFPDEEDRIERLKAQGIEERKFKQKQIATHIELMVLAVDFATGALVEEIALREVPDPQAIHTLNSFASPTPVLSGDLIIAHFGTFGTFAIGRETSKLAWERTLSLEHSVGPGSSPVVYEGKLVLICDGVDQQYVTSLDAQTGKTIWTTARPEMRAALGDQKKAYNTPVFITDPNGKKQLVCMGSQWLVSYDLETGDEIWKLDHGDGFSVVPRPVYNTELGLIYISTGFGKPELLAVKVDGSGDITEKDMIAWREPKRIPAKPSPLLVENLLYVISDGGVGTCFDSQSGEALWHERIDGNYSASPLFADGKIFLANQEGVVRVLAPGPNYDPLAENQLNGSIMASPIALEGSLVIRSDSALYRFGESAAQP
ncbi:MAG: PQQ-binding-like beta-propeller repeat protein [Verrucomicrobiota bacterium]